MSLDHPPTALIEQLDHLLFMDHLWLARLGGGTTGAQPPALGRSQRVWSRERWHAARRELDFALTEFIQALDEIDLERPIVFITQAEQVMVRCMTWAALTQQFNHQSLHRGEILRLLTISGVTFGNSDLLPLIVELIPPAAMGDASVDLALVST
jgi:uncharacterized damage-inducible protein DinB